MGTQPCEHIGKGHRWVRHWQGRIGHGQFGGGIRLRTVWSIGQDKVQLPLMRHFHIVVMDEGQLLNVLKGFINLHTSYIMFMSSTHKLS